MTPTNTGGAGGSLIAAPPVAVSGVTLLGLQLEEWVYVLTIFYTLMQIVWFIYRRLKERKE